MSTSALPPTSRDKFKIAVICALSIEANMVISLLDTIYRSGLGKAQGDHNAYTRGSMSGHNIVIAYLGGAGNNDACNVAAHLPLSFKNIEITFVVGICGVVPQHPETKREIVLGDCIVSTAAIQTDYGRRYDTGLDRKASLEDSLGRASPEVRTFISKLKTDDNLEYISTQLQAFLLVLSTKRAIAKYPTDKRDLLFKASRAHEHYGLPEKCDDCLPNYKTCKRGCEALGCIDDEFLIPRARLDPSAGPPQPEIHFGRFGTANHVLRSGAARDEMAKGDNIVAFEMESGGIWDMLKTIVIKSACDYADAHKSKDWQMYAAATAAAALKAILILWDVTDEPEEKPEGSEQGSRQQSSNDRAAGDGFSKRYNIGTISGGARFY